MSKRNQIQNALLTVNSATFQLLGDAYFNKHKWGTITSVGSVVGKDRTKVGTPDTLISTPQGKYIFVEYTVQSEGGVAKLSSDLAKCLDENKTGIAVSKIEKIILCATCQLNPSEQDQLQEQGASEGCVVEIVGIDALAWDLLQKYPDIAKEHLGVEVDTGQVLDAEAFVSQYQSTGWAAPLSTHFLGREEELSTALQHLEQRDVLIVTGKAGMGKSRFALECGQQFVAVHPEYELRCILNNGLTLYEDLKAHFPTPGYYLVLVDDANRLRELRQIIDLLGTNHSSLAGQIKLILTVRDYAVGNVIQVLPIQERHQPLQIGLLNNQQIIEIIKSDCGITNSYYHERINRIARGNPRMAVMAARVAAEKGDLASISDVSALYDEYFSSVVGDINDLKEQRLLQVAGIVAFLRVVAKDSDNLFAAVATGLNLDLEHFWEGVALLHSMEIIDLHENEVAKISDQILATYLIYRTFFKEQLCDFGVVLDILLGRSSERLSDAIYPVLGAFKAEIVFKRLSDYVEERWRHAQSHDDEAKLLALARTFYFINELDVLLLIQSRINGLPGLTEHDRTVLSEPDQSIKAEEPYIELLERLRYQNPDYAAYVVQLLFDYVDKKPTLQSRVARLLREGFCFQKESYLRRYDVESLVTQELTQRLTGPHSDLSAEILLDIAKKWLAFEFSSTSMESHRMMTITNFQVEPTPEIRKLRDSIWAMLFQIYQQPHQRKRVLEIIHSHASAGRREGNKQIMIGDAKSVLPFLQNISKMGIDESITGHAYIDFLDRNGVVYLLKPSAFFDTEEYELLRIMQPSRKGSTGSNWQERQKLLESERQQYFAAFELADYLRFLSQIDQLQDGIGVNQGGLVWQTSQVLMDLAVRDGKLFKAVVDHLLATGNKFGIQREDLIIAWVQAHSRPINALIFLTDTEFREKHVWLFTWHKNPSLVPSLGDFGHLLQLYKESPLGEIPTDFNASARYRELVPDALQSIVSLLLDRARTAGVALDLEWLFPDYGRPNGYLGDLIDTDFGFVKDVYLHHLSGGVHRDAQGTSFALLLVHDPDFIIEYIDWMYDRHPHLWQHEDPRNYAFLWRLDNCIEITAKVVLTVRNRERTSPSYGNSYLSTFFMRHEDEWSDEINNRIRTFFEVFISQHHGDRELMRLIFQVATFCPADTRVRIFEVFLAHNPSFEDFEQLPFEPSSWSWSGSAVPVYEKRIQFLQSLFPLLTGLPVLKHRRYIEEVIRGHRHSIERELRREFMDADR